MMSSDSFCTLHIIDLNDEISKEPNLPNFVYIHRHLLKIMNEHRGMVHKGALCYFKVKLQI